MVTVTNKRYKDIPTLEIVKAELRNKKVPLIIFVHGFSSAKEHNLHYAYLLAEEGFRVLLPDSLYHGERAENLSEMELSLRFWDVVLNNIKELEIVKNELFNLDLLDEEKIGVAGTSMGGITLLGALTQYRWINTAVSLMGSPTYEDFFLGLIKEVRQNNIEIPFTDEQLEQQLVILRNFDLSIQPEKLAGRPILFWHGERDRVVPFINTYEFYKQIIPLYEGREEKLKFIVDPNGDHKVSREGLLATVQWFKEHLLVATE